MCKIRWRAPPLRDTSHEAATWPKDGATDAVPVQDSMAVSGCHRKMATRRGRWWDIWHNSSGAGAGGGSAIRRARSLRDEKVWISPLPHHCDFQHGAEHVSENASRAVWKTLSSVGGPERGLKCVFCLPPSCVCSVFSCLLLRSSRRTSVVPKRMRTTQNTAVGDEERDLWGSSGARGKPEGNRTQIQSHLVMFDKVKNHKLLL